MLAWQLIIINIQTSSTNFDQGLRR